MGNVDWPYLPELWLSKQHSYKTILLVPTRWSQLASCNVTTPSLDFLNEIFEDRMFSRNTHHHWPPYSPDLSLLDLSVGNHVTVNMKKRQPNTVESLKLIVENVLSGKIRCGRLRGMLGKELCSVFIRTEGILNN